MSGMSADKQSRVLVMGDDMRVFLAAVRSLGRSGHEVHAAPREAASPALTSRYVSKVHELPRYSDNPEAWISTLLSVLRENRIDLIVPCCDSAILPLHAHRDRLAEFCAAIPNERVMLDLFDKQRTRAIAQALGISVAPGAALQADNSAEDLVATFGLPLVIKPRQSYRIDALDSWGKVWILDTVEEVRHRLREVDDRALYLVEGFFEGGVGVGVSVLASEGRILRAFQHRRLREGLGSSSSYRISEPVDEQLLRACQSVCSEVQLTGVCMFEFRRHLKDGSWVLLETNARLWGSLPLPVSLGVGFVTELHDLLVLGSEHEARPYRHGVRSRNLVLDAHNLLSAGRRLSVRSFPGFGVAVADFLLQPVRWAMGSERSDSFVSDDIKPGLAELWSLARRFKSGRVPSRAQSSIRAPKTLSRAA